MSQVLQIRPAHQNPQIEHPLQVKTPLIGPPQQYALWRF